MKRSRVIPELVDPPRRKRMLSEEEHALWETVARQIKPLRKKSRAAKAALDKAASDVATPAAAKAVVKAVAAEPSPSAKPARLPKAPAPPSPPPLAPLGRRERSQLSRGRKEIDARIDLHGMTQIRAHRVLQDFLRRAHADGMTFVLVITGKGKMTGAESERGVLRRQVPQWLALPEFRAMVVGFEEAHIGHGGEGALYVRIRRVRT
jgi:DNA-nicking Smr family endonuclease